MALSDAHEPGSDPITDQGLDELERKAIRRLPLPSQTYTVRLVTLRRLISRIRAREQELAEIRALQGDFSLECENETHTLNGEPILVVDEEGNPAGTGYFAHSDGTRFDHDSLPVGWPEGHHAEPCGRCWACRLSALGCGVIHVIDGAGVRDIKPRV